MDVTMADVVGELVVSGCSSLDDGGVGLYAWNAPSPFTANWGPFCFDDVGGQDLIESMLCHDTALFPSSSTTTNPATAVQHDDPQQECSPGEKGLRLLHLLMAAAEALSHKSWELAQVILLRLKDMVPSSSSSSSASNTERLATHFTDALQSLLDGSHAHAGRQSASRSHQSNISDVLIAFQMLQDMSPYMKFGHFTANQAILEEVAGDRRVHIVDYDLAEGIQWASLMQAMMSRPNGVSPPQLRISAITRGGGGSRAVQEAGRRLTAFAGSIGQPFLFGHCRLDSDEMFRPAAVRMVKGETLVANCILHQAAATTSIRRPPGSVASFLTGMADLGAKVVTVVEEEGEAEKEVGFVGHFMEELHRYSALWDSLEAGFPTESRARGLVEQVILGPSIAGAVSCAYRRMDADGTNSQARRGWGEWMSGSEFKAVPLSSFNHSQARLLLGLFNDGYTVEETTPNKIVLAWKARRLLSASVWAPPPISVPSAPADGALETEYDYIDSFLVDPGTAYPLV